MKAIQVLKPFNIQIMREKCLKSKMKMKFCKGYAGICGCIYITDITQLPTPGLSVMSLWVKQETGNNARS